MRTERSSLSPAWAKEMVRRNPKKTDPRVPVIRCSGCHRLRKHPRTEDSRTWACGCGCWQFIQSFPHDDEIPLALKLYEDEIDQKEPWKKAAKEIIEDWRKKYGHGNDVPQQKRIYRI
jgi:hypothetical protein